MSPSPSPTPTASFGDFPSWLTPTLLVSTLGVLVSLSTLATTVQLFRWLNTRRGKLSSTRPHSFGLHPTGEAVTVVMPLVIYNNGAVPIIVQDLRLRIEKTAALFKRQRREDARYLADHRGEFPKGATLEDEPRPAGRKLAWNGSRAGVGPGEMTVLPAVFAVAGRTAETMFIEFEQLSFYGLLGRGEHFAAVDVKLAHRKGWTRLCEFDLHLPFATLQPKYAVYRNRDEFEFDE